MKKKKIERLAAYGNGMSSKGPGLESLYAEISWEKSLN